MVGLVEREGDDRPTLSVARRSHDGDLRREEGALGSRGLVTSENAVGSSL